MWEDNSQWVTQNYLYIFASRLTDSLFLRSVFSGMIVQRRALKDRDCVFLMEQGASLFAV